MTILSRQISGYLENASWIRRMFETGAQLKQQYGEDAVCDFSLGNPDLPAPPAVAQGLRDMADMAEQPFAFGYMPNAGFGWAREKLAAHLCKEQGMPANLPIEASHVILTCGAAGALNVLFRTILDEGDEVLSFAPYFVEYGFYVQNHRGVFNTVPTLPDTFAPDLAALEKAIGPRTKALLINSPNNPTGVVYSREQLQGITDLLTRLSAQHGHPIWLIADEPYRFLAFDGVEVPSVLPLYPHAVVVSSFSKNLSLAGERLGYCILSPLLQEHTIVMGGLTLSNRILGFVNPPVVGQHLMAAALGSQVDVSIYAQRRTAMAEVLSQSGYNYQMPKGAFYFFPKAPGGDDVAFVARLLEQKVLAVPGTGFGRKGHFRLAFCVDEAIIRRSAAGFAAALS